jgi:ABC-type sugar transport system ATPase subunit
MSANPIVRLEGVTKLYGGIAALQSADFDLARSRRSSGKTALANPPFAS